MPICWTTILSRCLILDQHGSPMACTTRRAFWITAVFSGPMLGWQAPPLSAAVIYEVHIGTFTAEGTFRAAIDRLDALVELGITHVEIMPVAAWDGERGWGYDGVDLFAPHQVYGGPEGLKQLVNACHTRGLAVLLDVVYNHLGPVGNYLQRFGPYFTHSHTHSVGRCFEFRRSGSAEVRRFLVRQRSDVASGLSLRWFAAGCGACVH